MLKKTAAIPCAISAIPLRVLSTPSPPYPLELAHHPAHMFYTGTEAFVRHLFLLLSKVLWSFLFQSFALLLVDAFCECFCPESLPLPVLSMYFLFMREVPAVFGLGYVLGACFTLCTLFGVKILPCAGRLCSPLKADRAVMVWVALKGWPCVGSQLRWVTPLIS